MRWAIATSIVLHAFFIGLVFKNGGGKSNAYPKVIPVHLASMPVKRGVKEPAVAKAPARTSKNQKIEKPKDKPRVAEVNRNIRPSRKKKTPEPKPAVEQQSQATETAQERNKGLPQGVELGSEFGSARLDATGFDSPYFLNVLFSKIRNNWDNPYEGADSVGCVIYFVVNKRGRITDSAIEKSSGYAAYDQAALRAVLGAKPPPLPNQFGSDELGIHLEFKYLPYN